MKIVRGLLLGFAVLMLVVFLFVFKTIWESGAFKKIIRKVTTQSQRSMARLERKILPWTGTPALPISHPRTGARP